MKCLVVDIGGSTVKFKLSNQDEVRKFPSGRELTPAAMLENLRKSTSDWQYDRVSIGYPGHVVGGSIQADPYNLAPGWVDCDIESAFDCPVRIVNDAVMQAIGVFRGGKMLYLGFGTSIGSVLVMPREVASLAVGHLRFRNGKTFEGLLNKRGLKRTGLSQWRNHALRALQILKDAFLPDESVVGGGNARKLGQLPQGVRRGGNAFAFVGGERLWLEAFAQLATPGGYYRWKVADSAGSATPF